MVNGTRNLAELLDELLDLSFEKGEGESKQHILRELLTNLHIDGNTKDSIREYIELEFAEKLTNLGAAVRDFKNNYDAWREFIKYEYDESTRTGYAVALQLVILLISNSLLNKQLFANEFGLKGDLKLRLDTCEDEIVLIRLRELYYDVLSVSANPIDLLILYTDIDSNRSSKLNVLNHLAEGLTEPYLQSYLQFENCYYMFFLETGLTSFTIDIWLELLNVSSNRILTIAGNICVEVKEGVLYVTNDEFIIAMFDAFDFSLLTIYHVALVFDGIQLTLNIDGNNVQSVNLIQSEINVFDRLELGSTNSSFKLYRITIWKNDLSGSMLKLIHKMGLLWCVNEDWAPFYENLALGGTQHMVDYTQFRSLAESNILDDRLARTWIATLERDSASYTLSLSDDNAAEYSKCLYYKSSDILSNMNAIFALRIVIILIWEASEVGFIYGLLEHLFILLKCRSLKRQFESEFGYTLLSHLLTGSLSEKSGTAMSIDFLNLILGFCGWRNDDPSLSMISNKDAYKKLVMNLGLWANGASISQEQCEILRFLLFQTDWIQHSNYSEYNKLQIKDLKIIEAFTIQQHLLYSEAGKQNIINNLRPDLVNFYASLLQTDLTHKDIAYLLHFVYYELKSYHFESADIVLNSIDKVLLKALKEDDQIMVGKICNSIPLKILMVIINEGSIGESLTVTGLSLLFKCLSIQHSAHKSFAKSGGYLLLLSILKSTAYFRLEKIVKLLFSISVGQAIDPNSPDYDRTAHLEGTDISHIAIEVHALILSFFQHFVDRGVEEAVIERLESSICSYISMLKESANGGNFETLLFDPNASPLTEHLSNLLVSLQASPHKHLHRKSAACIVEFMANNVLRHVKQDHSLVFLDYLRGILSMKGANEPYTGKKTSNKHINYIKPFICMEILPIVLEKFLEPQFILEAQLQQTPSVFKNIIGIFEEVQALLCSFLRDPEEYLRLQKCGLTLLDVVKDCSITNPKQSDVSKLIQLVQSVMYNFLYLIMNQQLGLSEVQWTEFLKRLLFFQEALFGMKTSKVEKDFSSICMVFLIYCIQKLPGNENVVLAVSCLRTIIVHHEGKLRSVAYILSRSHRETISGYLSQIMASNDDEVIRSLQSPKATASFDPIYSEFLQNTLVKKVTMNDSNEFSSKGAAYESLLQIKSSVMENVLIETQNIYNIFKKDNALFAQKIVKSESKRVLNFINDLEGDLIHSHQKMNDLKLDTEKFKKLHGFSSTFRQEWSLDACEDYNRMKKRLVSLYLNPLENSDNQQLVTDRTITPNSQSNQIKYYHGGIVPSKLVPDIEKLDIANKDTEDNNRKVLRSLKSGDNIRRIWNCTRITGLNLTEGILVLGSYHLYFIENYIFSSKEKKVCNLADVPSSARDVTARLIAGTTESSIKNEKERLIISWELAKLVILIKRPFLLRDVAIEFIFEHGRSCLVTFSNTTVRDNVYRHMDKAFKGTEMDPVLFETLNGVNQRTYEIGFKNGISAATLSTKFASVFSPTANLVDTLQSLKLWRNGYISNFYYLIIVNTLAGRTFNDLTQYPVFPWVIADYTSEELDLSDPKSFRDLSKPIGVQDSTIMQQFVERYEALSALEDDNSPPFHYGTHYSSAMIVSSYLIRLQPFVVSYLLLQGGRFGPPDRIFNSIERSWKSASSENTTDVRELIPEFFYLPDFLTNVNDYEFGKLQSGEQVGDVILPPWAKNDPKIFISKNREALESPYVSENLHKWIDLIFGFKQKGKEAIESVNVFNRLSYPGAVHLDSINDENERRTITGIIHNFGQTPLQLFDLPHPPRNFRGIRQLGNSFSDTLRLPDSSVRMTSAIDDQSTIASVELSYSHNQPQWTGYFHDTIALLGTTARVTEQTSLLVGNKLFKNMHSTTITSLANYHDHYFITGDDIGICKLWKASVTGDSSHVEHVKNFYGHFSEIKEIVAAKEYNTFLTLDTSGAVYTWDILNGDVIQTITEKATHASLSGSTGNIVTATKDGKVTVYDLNGTKYTSIALEERITAISFMSFNNIDASEKRHMYWKEEDIVIVGNDAGKIGLYELTNRSGKWDLIRLQSILSGKENKITAISSRIRTKEQTSDSSEVAEVTRAEIAAGDSQGYIHIWM
ncbi:HGL285Cp [Eremothecium sinecaudum]|uniref:Beige protein homolog 1 n=1 Tax=Eremothecium sinecaudum TaxID=45286 RepID=A0A0X8HVA8_9SACH|nr:HGL285Cp [Eremothecium sinecaudum]AMD22055.1 HGL285Cp [Eremothecium sinecaudum]